MISINDITSKLQEHNPCAIADVMKAYNLAEYAHEGVYRESGEPYITHPLNVANNLLNMEVYDGDTICAALLHDTVEDNEEITLKQIAELINRTTAELVDGVTKMRKMNFSNKKDLNDANTRKIITGLTKDVRIILIKLADRLHNMKTLDYKKPQKRKENAVETMELFVPLALSIGAYQIKSILEDLALQYIEPDVFARITYEKSLLEEQEKEFLSEIKFKISEILKSKDISHEILLRTKNICTTYKKMLQGYKLENMYDLFYLKILVDEVDDCYKTLSYVHRNYPPINGRFKDYIYSPRTNLYRSLHTTVSDSKGKIFKTKIRTFDMDKVSAYGIAAYWNIDPNKNSDEVPTRKSIEETQKRIRESHQFAKKLIEIDDSFKENRDFVKEIKNELLTDHVYVYKHNGEIIELPKGSTALDFACEVYPDLIDKMTEIIINGKEAAPTTKLKNRDRIEINTNKKADHKSIGLMVAGLTSRQKINRRINRHNKNKAL